MQINAPRKIETTFYRSKYFRSDGNDRHVVVVAYSRLATCNWLSVSA